MEYYPRKIELKMEAWYNREECVILRGPRQSGKTTLFKHICEKLDGEYMTLEDEGILRVFEESPRMFVKRYGVKKNLFIDEVQYSKKAGRILKFIHDTYPELKLFITGSGSFDVKENIGGYLVGRAVYFNLKPLDFEEFLLWKDPSLHRVFMDMKDALLNFLRGEKVEFEDAFSTELKEMLMEYIKYGGFPAIVKEDDEQVKIELLRNLYQTYLEKDVFFFFGVMHLEKFRQFLRYLAINNGSILELSHLSRELRADYRTLEKYISIMVNTYILSLLPSFHRNLSTELRKAKKFYFIDTGLRNAIINSYSLIEGSSEMARLLENFVHNELSEYSELKYWRTTGKAEVDFIINYEGQIVPVEVKSSGVPGRSFRSFIEHYHPQRAIVFTFAPIEIKEIGKTKVAYLPHYFV